MIPLRDTQGSGHFPWMTILLIVVTAYVFYIQVTTPDLELLLYQYGLIPATIDPNQPLTWYRFATAIFLHGGLLHIISNMLFLWVFGDNVEERLGFWYLPVYLGGGILANVAQYLTMSDAPIPIIGASGAVATILGSYFLFFPRHQVLTLVPLIFVFFLTLPAPAILIYWFFTQVISGFVAIGAPNDVGGVAYLAHVAGFAIGLIVALIWFKLQPARQPS